MFLRTEGGGGEALMFTKTGMPYSHFIEVSEIGTESTLRNLLHLSGLVFGLQYLAWSPDSMRAPDSQQRNVLLLILPEERKKKKKRKEKGH